MRWRWACASVALVLGCGAGDPFPPGSAVKGVWGAQGAGLMADDTSAHVHIACTYGNVHQPIVTDPNGEFAVPGDYNVRAYPVDAGVFHSARFTGLIVGRKMVLTVQLTDTAVTLGPVSLVFDQDPVMGPCPICFGPKARALSAVRQLMSPWGVPANEP